jgi:hypothetical protein
MREWYHYNQHEKRNLMIWFPNNGFGEGGWVHTRKRIMREWYNGDQLNERNLVG